MPCPAANYRPARTLRSTNHSRSPAPTRTGTERRQSSTSLLEGRREAPAFARHGRLSASFLPPPHRSVHAVLPHTAHRRPSPPAFGVARLTRLSRKGLGVTTSLSRLISPSWLRE